MAGRTKKPKEVKTTADGAEVTPVTTQTPSSPSVPMTQTPFSDEEPVMKLSDVKKLIADAIAQSKDTKPMKPKKVTEHYAHAWRIDGKWVVDFVDQNTDPYLKQKVLSFQNFNERTREFEAWLELQFEDGTTKKMFIPQYVKNRVMVYCPIIERMKIDKSYSIGEVDKNKEVGDMMVRSGVSVDQEVTMYEEVLKLKTPDGKILTLPSYVIA